MRRYHVYHYPEYESDWPKFPEYEFPELPDFTVKIPGKSSLNGEADELWVWHDKPRKRTITWGSGEFMNQDHFWCDELITPEEALADYLTGNRAGVFVA
jgi:hypothetical protein